jgi:hypothetical protein
MISGSYPAESFRCYSRDYSMIQLTGAPSLDKLKQIRFDRHIVKKTFATPALPIRILPITTRKCACWLAAAREPGRERGGWLGPGATASPVREARDAAAHGERGQWRGHIRG